MRPSLLSLFAPLVLAACNGAPSKSATPTSSATPPLTTTEVCGPDAPRGLEIGDCAPEFSLPDASGTRVALSSLRGRVALVDISAVW